MAGHDTYKATFDGGALVCKPGPLSSVAAQIHAPLREGRRVYVRMKRADHTCVTLVGFPPEATAHNWVGEPVATPDWVQSFINFMTH